MARPPRIDWDLGTAYDFFISLVVLHKPADHGLRGVWAAGMRSRLPAAERDFLEEVMGTVVGGPPMEWIHQLPPPKDAATALRALEKMPAAERITLLLMGEENPATDLLRQAAKIGSYTDADVDAFRDLLAEHYEEEGKKGKKLPRKELTTMFDWWANAEEFGTRFLKALAAYYEVFFAEEERRIYPALQDALEQAQALSEEMAVPDLLEELSRGVSMADELAELQALTLAPAFWSAPLIYYHHFSKDHMMILFGARPDEASLIPGEVVPDLLVRSLKALSDPTRLKIMHYLAHESMTPTQLANKLRLRAPTVVHHLQTLRVAGLVLVTIAEGKERSYGTRAGSVLTTCDVLQRFLGIEEEAALAEETV